MNYILFDNPQRKKLLPFVYTRPVADIRIGILTIRQKWEYYLKKETSSLTESYLREKFPLVKENVNLLINGAVIPNADLVNAMHKLNKGEALAKDNEIVALNVGLEDVDKPFSEVLKIVNTNLDFTKVLNTWDIFSLNDQAIRDDFDMLTRDRKSAPLSDSNFVQGPIENIFLEEDATVEFAFLNASEGPIYIGKGAEVMEGAKIRGPFALCEHSTVKMDAKIYSGTTVGPHCKVGGEIQNVVFFGYSNKGHDGYLGNSVIGEWCNFGADTNNSNLKNTYDSVRLWSYDDHRFISTGLQFCGLIMGDHSKTGINTMFNTGTVVGVSCNIFGAGYQRNFIPSFSWGGPHGMIAYNLKKSFDVAAAVMKRRNLVFDDNEENIFTHIYTEEQK